MLWVGQSQARAHGLTRAILPTGHLGSLRGTANRRLRNRAYPTLYNAGRWPQTVFFYRVDVLPDESHSRDGRFATIVPRPLEGSAKSYARAPILVQPVACPPTGGRGSLRSSKDGRISRTPQPSQSVACADSAEDACGRGTLARMPQCLGGTTLEYEECVGEAVEPAA